MVGTAASVALPERVPLSREEHQAACFPLTNLVLLLLLVLESP